MMYCNICGKNLFSSITFSNMFKLDYETHQKCDHDLIFNMDEEVIPIESNIIIYDYVFSELKDGYNEEYLWSKYMNKKITKHLNNKEWSILYFYDEILDFFIKNYNPYLLINLSKNPILLISLKKIETFYLEGL